MNTALSIRTCAAAAIALLAFAACSRDRTQSTNQAAAGATIYPAGIVAPADWASATRAGIYPSDSPKTCCFLAGKSLLTLDNPAGSQLAVFTFYVPTVAPLQRSNERVVLRLNGKQAGSPATLSPGMQDVTFTIPASIRAERNIKASLTMSVSWVPKRIGLNDDKRVLSVMLIRVGYI